MCLNYVWEKSHVAKHYSQLNLGRIWKSTGGMYTVWVPSWQFVLFALWIKGSLRYAYLVEPYIEVPLKLYSECQLTVFLLQFTGNILYWLFLLMLMSMYSGVILHLESRVRKLMNCKVTCQEEAFLISFKISVLGGYNGKCIILFLLCPTDGHNKLLLRWVGNFKMSFTVFRDVTTSQHRNRRFSVWKGALF